MTSQTHFGYQQVAVEEKTKHVKAVFDSVAPHYDRMNDLMSLGLHRLWKRYACLVPVLRPGAQVLDVASGSGDLGRLLKQRVGETGKVILTDINEAMLGAGRDRLTDQGSGLELDYVLANAECLPFPNNHFDLISIGFGLRNVTHKLLALKQFYHALKPGGQLVVLEFSTPTLPGIKPIYDMYSFSVLPVLGHWVAEDADSYRYLAESIRMHPDQARLKKMIEQAGLEDCCFQNLCGGVVAIHTAYKY